MSPLSSEFPSGSSFTQSKSQVLAMALYAPTPISESTIPALPPQIPHRGSNRPGIFLPQELCICCSFCLKHSSLWMPPTLPSPPSRVCPDVTFRVKPSLISLFKVITTPLLDFSTDSPSLLYSSHTRHLLIQCMIVLFVMFIFCLLLLESNLKEDREFLSV